MLSNWVLTFRGMVLACLMATINAQTLTFDLAAAKTAVEGFPFEKGFTNMAQAFATAEDMFTKGSRKDSQ